VLLDLRPLNDLLDEFQYEILNNIIKKLSGFKFYCLIDIAKAYCQLAYTSESGEELFCFSIGTRRFCFVGVPYGVKSTPSYYALALQDIFRDILKTFNDEQQATEIYFDDIMNGSNSIAVQADYAKNVLNKLDEYEIRINPSKFKIFQKEIKNFRRIFTEEGSSLDIDQILDINFNKKGNYTKKELKSILGATAFFADNVINMAQYTAVLHGMTKDLKIEFPNNKNLQLKIRLLLKNLKNALLNAITITHPGKGKKYLFTDTSKEGLSVRF
jgi:transposase-like protein